MGPELEEWLPIKGFERYQVSNYGRIKSLPKNGHNGLILKPSETTDGYFMVSLFSSSVKRKSCYVHRLVAEAWIGNPNNYPEVNHLFGHKWINTIYELEWCTTLHNLQHAQELKKRHQSNKVVNVFTGEIHINVTEAAIYYGIGRSLLSKMLHGDRPNKSQLIFIDKRKNKVSPILHSMRKKKRKLFSIKKKMTG